MEREINLYQKNNANIYYFIVCLPVINILSNAKNVCGKVVKHCKPSFRHEDPIFIISLKQL